MSMFKVTLCGGPNREPVDDMITCSGLHSNRGGLFLLVIPLLSMARSGMQTHLVRCLEPSLEMSSQSLRLLQLLGCLAAAGMGDLGTLQAHAPWPTVLDMIR